MLGYVYAALWAVIAIYLFVSAIRVNKILFLGSGFFLFMAVWWLVNEFTEVNLFDGMYGIIFKTVVGVVLAVFIIFYVIYKKKNSDN